MIRMNRIRVKLNKFSSGFSLAETLVALLIVLMVSSILVAGLPAAFQAYSKVVDGANAQVLLSTGATRIRDELGFATDVYYMVSTDKGAYKIEVHGLNACLECIGIEEGKTYILMTRGISIPLIGIYSNIISYESND